MPQNRSVRFSSVFIILGIYDFTHHQPRLLSFVHDELVHSANSKELFASLKKDELIVEFQVFYYKSDNLQYNTLGCWVDRIIDQVCDGPSLILID